MTETSFDLAIVGSGFGGSIMAMIARRLGLWVALIERGRHPRFAIGESTAPLFNLILEELCRRFDLPRVLPLSSYGAWQREYPEMGCGLKRGFTFYKHEEGNCFQSLPDRGGPGTARPRDRFVSFGGMTPAYCSPEQFRRRPLSQKTDIWSWGVW